MKPLLFIILGALVIGGLILHDDGSVQKPTPITKPYVAPTPAQKRAQERKSVVESCNNFMESIALNTYSELSISQRGMKAACDAQLQHPDQEIIRADAR
jgi:hypothetical protein